MPIILKELKPIARKIHICSFCQRPIKIGERYNRTTLVHDRDLYEWKAHECCSGLATHIEDEGDGITTNDFLDFIGDAMHNHECKGCMFNNNTPKCKESANHNFCLPYILNFYKAI